MSFKTRIISLIFIFGVSLISSIYGLETDDAWSNWDEQTNIDVSIVGSSEINLDLSNRLVRAYVDITNFDPSDGRYMMRIIQSLTDKIIAENEIVIREKSNGEAGADVAYLIDDDVITTNGTIIQGDYKIEVFSEKGDSIASTTFTVIKPSEYGINSIKKLLELESSKESSEETNDLDDNKSNENSSYTNPDFVPTSKIPSWVKNIFILYSEGSITENELLSALKFLIEQRIIEISQ
jgi:hypothetical protein